ncbi:MAG: hypothetical protein WA738_07100 [Candidatus Angelobacter sp.]
MKTLRKILIILAAPAAILFGLKEISGSPIYKGDDSGMAWKAEQNPAKFVLTNDLGDTTCVLRLKIAGNAQGYKAALANRTVLKVNQVTEDDEDGWIELADGSSSGQDKFKWPSGSGIYVYPQPNAAGDLKVENWKLFRTDKSPDTYARARGRKIGLMAALGCLVLALIGGSLEAAERLKEKPAVPQPFTAQKLVEDMIQNVASPNSEEKTQLMRAILTKLVFQGVSDTDVLAGIPGTDVEKQGLFVAAVRQLKKQFAFFQKELGRLSARL